MKVLITGGAGYLGSVTTLELIAAGHDVVCLDTRESPPGWELWVPRREGAGRARFVTGDVSEPSQLKQLARESDAIVHMAFIVGGPACRADPARARAVALLGTEKVLEAATDKPVVFLSTDSVYGNAASGACSEDCPRHPASLYGELKAMCEDAVAASANFTILRVPTNFGVSPVMRSDLLVHHLVSEMFHTGKIKLYEGAVTRTVVHVRDAASAVRFVLENRAKAGGGVFNVATCSLQKARMAEIIAGIFGGAVLTEVGDERSDPERRDFTLGCSRIQAIGWKPMQDFALGIRELRAFFSLIQRQ